MTAAQQAALDKWAEISQERAAIEEFIDWAQAAGRGNFRFALSRADLLDQFYGINRKELEEARRAILEEAGRGKD